jgi:4-carboxymuconolactone decarboxylase
MDFPQTGDAKMDTQELYRRGLAIRKEIFGTEAVEKRMQAVGDYGAPLQHIINAYAYGDVWARPGLERRIRSLVVLGMTAAINRPAEFKVHMNGALNNGCTPEEIREVCLLVALYCGVPASNDAHRIALETFAEKGIASPGKP